MGNDFCSERSCGEYDPMTPINIDKHSRLDETSYRILSSRIETQVRKCRWLIHPLVWNVKRTARCLPETKFFGAI